MAAADFDMVVERHADYVRTFTWQSDAGVPVNISAYTWQMQVRKHRDSPGAPLLDLTPYLTLYTDGTDGVLVLHVPDEVTSAITFTEAEYDIRYTNAAGVTGRWIQGRFLVSRGVTR